MKSGSMQLKDLYQKAKEHMKRVSIENPSLETSILLSRVNAIDNLSDIYTHPEREVGQDKIAEFCGLLERRLGHEPVSYITGEKEFYSRPFTVSPDVLIPRPETELLVEETLRIVEKIKNPVILDVGTGSGCIAVTLACELGESVIYATDVSVDALRIAQLNAARHDCTNRINLINGDLSEHFSNCVFDVVVSNPPYISESELTLLEPEVRDFEPHMALLAGEDGLQAIREIVTSGIRVLKDGGYCLLEVGADQAERVKALFEESGYRETSSFKDIANIERVVRAKWKK